ncbi:hypothetical protein [Mitsuaria sp. GD03876]|nr:hypothetical protein [Mitsuaria sp. GD03876]MDH0867725.1 hypothetical protein [Mitsuaria sp. GD03876]
MTLITNAPRAIQQACTDAANKMVFEPSSYDGRPYLTVVEQAFVFNVD